MPRPSPYQYCHRKLFKRSLNCAKFCLCSFVFFSLSFEKIIAVLFSLVLSRQFTMAASNATSAITTTDSSDVFALYRYTPSLAGAMLFAICFLVAFAAHFIHLFRLKTLYFTPFTIGGLCKRHSRLIQNNLLVSDNPFNSGNFGLYGSRLVTL